MKYLKYGAYALLAIGVVVGGLFAYIAATFDPNAYKADITKKVAEETGRTLSIDGDIELTFFPKIGVTLGKTALSERDPEVEFAGVDDFRVALAFLPLLTGEVVVDAVVLDGLRARVIKHADGTTNLDDLTASDGKKADAKADDSDSGDTESTAKDGGSPVKLDIEAVRIINAAFTYQDEQAGATYEISDLTLETGRIALGVPTDFKYSALVRGNQPTIDLRTSASGKLNADLEKQIFKVDALEAKVEGVAATLSALVLTVNADVEARTATQWTGVSNLVLDASGSIGEDTFETRVAVPRLVLDNGAIAIEQLVTTLTGNFAGTKVSELRLDVPKLDMNLASQRINIEGLALRAAATQDGNDLSVNVGAPQLAITPEQASGAAITAVLQARGPDLKADANIKLSAVTGSARALRIGELAIDIDATQADNAIKGRVTTPVTGDLEKQIFRLPKLAGQYEVSSPALPMETTTIPLAAVIGADLKNETLNVDLKTRFDESNIKGVFDIKKFADPFLKFDVAIDTLNVDKYKSTEAEPEKKKSSDTGGPASGEEKESPIDLSPLKALHLDGKLRIGSLIASKIKLSDVSIDVKAEGGIVQIDPLLAKLYGGTIRGVVTADANTNKFTFKQTLSGVTVGPLLSDALDSDLLDGKGNIAFDLTAQGDTVTALTKSLSGAANLALKNGALKGIDLGQSLSSAGDLLSLKKNSETTASPEKKTGFSDLSASFAIDKGKARNEDFSLSSKAVKLTGAGDINLAEGGVDYLAKASLGSSSDITIPVQITGPITALKYKMQFSDAIADQGKKRLAAEKEKLKEKQKEVEKKLETKLESTLKDKLLGGETEPASDGTQAAPVAPTVEPKKEIKDRLKKLLR